MKSNLSDGGALTLKVNHLDNVNVSVGDIVLPGQLIGISGKTGNAADESNGEKRIGYYHTHIQAMVNGESVNPENYLPEVQK